MRYSWALWVILFVVALPVWLLMSCVLVAVEESGYYVGAAVVTVVAILVAAYVVLPAGVGGIRFAELWAAGHEVDRVKALEGTYTYARRAAARGVSGPRLGLACCSCLSARSLVPRTSARPVRNHGRCRRKLIGADRIHSFVETAMRPARVPSPVIPVSVTPCRALARLLPRGRTSRARGCVLFAS